MKEAFVINKKYNHMNFDMPFGFNTLLGINLSNCLLANNWAFSLVKHFALFYKLLFDIPHFFSGIERVVPFP